MADARTPRGEKRPRTALVTGASSGIGRALALRLAQDRVHVVLLARRVDLLSQLADQIRAGGGQATVCPCDLLQLDQTVATLRQVDREVFGLDLVIANAGIAVTQARGQASWEAIADMLRLNFDAAVATLTALVPAMIARGGGHLVGISSLAAYALAPGAGAYCASKAGFSTFLDGLRLELAGTGIAVTAVHPGFVRTPSMVDRSYPTPGMIDADVAADHIVRRLPAAPAWIDFPWSTAWAARLLRVLPRSLLHAVLRRWVTVGSP